MSAPAATTCATAKAPITALTALAAMTGAPAKAGPERCIAIPYMPALPQSVVDWLGACPEPAALSAALASWRASAKPTECASCEDKFPRAELRQDETAPFEQDGVLICRECWEASAAEYEPHDAEAAGGTVGDPDWRAPPWPEAFEMDADSSPVNSGDILYDGDLFAGRFGIHVGRAVGFNPRTRWARRVTLDEYGESCAEAGTVPKEHYFFSVCGRYEERRIPVDADEGADDDAEAGAGEGARADTEDGADADESALADAGEGADKQAAANEDTGASADGDAGASADVDASADGDVGADADAGADAGAGVDAGAGADAGAAAGADNRAVADADNRAVANEDSQTRAQTRITAAAQLSISEHLPIKIRQASRSFRTGDKLAHRWSEKWP